jgi:hypothetical protein
MSYVAVKPVAEAEQYTPNSVVDFLIDVGVGNAILPNTLRLNGVLFVQDANGNNIVGDENLKIDGRVGCNAIVQQIITQFSDRTIENFQYHPRYLAMKSQTNETVAGKMLNAHNATEVKTMVDDMEPWILASPTPDVATYGRSFSVKPMCCLNSASGSLAYTKTGQVKISITLASSQQILYGGDASTHSYIVKELELSCRVASDQTAPKDVVMSVLSCVKQNITSNNTSLSVIVPIPTQSFSASFKKQADEADTTLNYTSLDTLPSCERVELSFSDSLSNLIEFPLETNEEITLNYAVSMGTQMKHQITYADEVVGLGFNYNELLRNTKLGVNILSGVVNTAPYCCYMYFRGIILM